SLRVLILPSEVAWPVRGRPEVERIAQVTGHTFGPRILRQRRFADLRLCGPERHERVVERVPVFQPRDDAQPPPRSLIQRAFFCAADEWLRAERNGDIELVPLVDPGELCRRDAAAGELDPLA